MWQIIKDVVTDDAFFFTLMVVLVGAASFGLGRHTGLEGGMVQRLHTDTSGMAAVEEGRRAATPPVISGSQEPTAPATTSLQLVASRNGTKYHYLWCASAGRINEENKVYFDSFAAARAAGYTPAANCDGLE